MDTDIEAIVRRTVSETLSALGIVAHNSTTYTAREAARVLGVSPARLRQIVKLYASDKPQIGRNRYDKRVINQIAIVTR